MLNRGVVLNSWRFQVPEVLCCAFLNVEIEHYFGYDVSGMALYRLVERGLGRQAYTNCLAIMRFDTSRP